MVALVTSETGGRPRGRPRSFDADAALEQAARAFHRSGFAGTSTEVLAEAMGLSKPSIYAAYGDKQTLFKRALEHRARAHGARLLAAFERGSTRRAALRALFDEALAIYAPRELDEPRGCLISSAGIDAVEEVPELGRWLHAFFARMDAFFGAALASRPRRGRAKGPDDEQLGRLLASLLRDLAMRSRAGASQAELESFTETALLLLAGPESASR
jgi:AcrR family transcriptional regulator